MYTRETAKLVGQNNGFSTDHLDERKQSNALFEVCERSSVRMSYTLDTSLAGGLKILDETEERGSRTPKQWRSHKTNNGEQTQYYPFGLKHKMYAAGSLKDFKEDPAGPGGTVLTNVTETDYQYKYQGQELQDELGLNWYDYGARNYDPALGRWHNIDPLAETYKFDSPYAYVNNNPVYFVDVKGMYKMPKKDQQTYSVLASYLKNGISEIMMIKLL